MSIKSFVLIAALLALVVALAVGCAPKKTSPPPPSSGAVRTPGAPATGPTARPSGPVTPGQKPVTGTGATMAGQIVRVGLTEWSVTLSPATIKPGTVRFEIMNTGQNTHAFEVKGQGVDIRSKDVPAGKSDTLMANLKAGTYQTYCPLDAHAEKGMKATLTVK